MNALVKKEIRLLLPSWIAAMLLAIFPVWFQSVWSQNPDDSSFFEVAYVLGVSLLGLASFGQEFSSMTFTLLLSQPMPRQRIWLVKIYTLAGAFSLVSLAFFISWKLCAQFFSWGNSFYIFGFASKFESYVIFAFAVLCGGLWSTLLLRQVTAAFWFVFLAPGILMVLLLALGDWLNFGVTPEMQAFWLLLYSIAGFFFARWLFFRAQDVQWTGGTIALPEMRGTSKRFARGTEKRCRHPRAALWRKEIQLHQSQFVMASALLLLHFGVLATRTFGHFGKNSSTEFILETFWGLWLVMPLLVGCAAVAEERKLGTLEGQLCLPVKRRTQFAIKLFVVLLLSVLLGAVIPLLLEGLRILPDIHFGIGTLEPGWQNYLSVTQLFLVNCLGTFTSLLPLLTLFGIAAAIGLISFYVSSLTRNTLQALAPALLGILMGFFGLFFFARLQTLNLNFLWPGPLPYFIGVPVMLLTLLALAFWNFQHVRTSSKMWLRNFFTFVLALVFAGIATLAVYHRAWEKLTPFEPPHGSARLSQSNPASLDTQFGEISVRLPDGKIWMSNFMADQNNLNPISMLLGNFKTTLADGKFINDSNWLTVQRSYRELIGIKTDGSLWVSDGPEPKGSFQNGKWTINEDNMMHLMPFGKETNWSSFVPAPFLVLLVKNDGTLWRWGRWRVTNGYDFGLKHKQWPGLRAFMPHRLGTESNWAEVFRYHYATYLRKTDGSLWVYGNWENWDTNGQTLLEVEPGFTVQSMNLGRDRFRSVARIRDGLEYDVGVRSDGTFRICADELLALVKGKRYRDYEWFPTDLQIGDGTNWLAVAGDRDRIVTLKNDGTLWLWNFSSRRLYFSLDEQEVLNTKPVRLGTHSDWIAISGIGNDVAALAADGSLWFWPIESVEHLGDSRGLGFLGNGNSRFEPLLDISHKPQYLRNIFSGQH